MIRRLLFLAMAAPLAAQDNNLDRYLNDLARKCWEQRARSVARIRTPAEARQRQRYIRAKVLEEIGGFPEKTALNARITGTLDRDGYRVEKLIYDSLPGFHVSANVYVPAGARPPYAAVVGVAGHSDAGKAYAVYQRAWIGLAKRGFLVLAFDPWGQGERIAGPGGTTGHTMAGLQCLLTGTNIARYEMWDGIRAVDYLLARGDVDPRRIAVAGNSGGGTQSAYLAVVEPRLAAAAPSCYITSWEKLWSGPGPQDAEQVFAGFLKDGLDFPDFLIAFAPRPIEMLTAVRDFFPIDGARATYAEARRIFEVLGQADRAGFFEYDDPHGWSKPRREATYRWLEKWLHDRNDDGAEPDFETEPEANLRCAPGPLGGETVQSLNQALAERLYKPRKPSARIIASRIGLEWDRPATAVKARQGKAAVLCIGKCETLAAAGGIVQTVEPRGYIEKEPQAKGYTRSYQTAMRALLVGKTMVGIQVEDVLRAFEALAGRADVDPARIGIYGKGNAGVLALYAAALEPRIAEAAAEGSVLSYMDIVRAQRHEGLVDLIVPGVLRDFDLPDLAAAIAPRPVRIIAPRHPDGTPASLEEAKARYTRVEEKLDPYSFPSQRSRATK